MRLFYNNGATKSPYGSTRVPPDGNISNAKISHLLYSKEIE